MYILFDPSETRQDLLPLTYTRPIADCRLGIMTIRGKWEHYLSDKTYTLSESYLYAKFPTCTAAGSHIYINGSILPDANLIAVIKNMDEEQAVVSEGMVIAFRSAKGDINYENAASNAAGMQQVAYGNEYMSIRFPHDIFRMNGDEIANDFLLLTNGKVSQPLSKTNLVVGDGSMLFVEEGAVIECAVFNTKGGPIYIGKDTELMEGCMIRGPFAICEHAGLKMGTKIYGGTTIGPHCRVGGEVSNGVFFGYSNKGHDGFIGNSVVGEWCNLGADTNCSNLKNNYGNVAVWNYREEVYASSGLQFHGLIMGDHAKSGINSMFNTGTVVGVAANIFGGGFPEKFIPSFSWGGAEGMATFRFDKALEVAERMMERRGVKLEQADINILQISFERDAKYRKDKSHENR